MKNKVRFFLLPALFCLLASGMLAAAERKSTDAELFGELCAAYQNSAYPAVIGFAEQMEKAFPRSGYMARALIYKAESYYALSRYSDAAREFTRALPFCANDTDLYVQAGYWQGRSYFQLKDYGSALKSFYVSARRYRSSPENSSSKKTDRFFALDILYAGNCYAAMGEHEKALPLFEHVVSDGASYTESEYASAVQSLYASYSACGKHRRLLSLHATLKESDGLEPELLNRLTLYAGDSYLALKEYKAAYGAYCEVLAGTDASLAAVALQKAYAVASEHGKQVGQEPGDVLKDARGTLFEYDSLLEEFWVRLAIDAFDSGQTEKSMDYFDKAESSGASSYLALIGLYRARLRNSPEESLETLLKYAGDSGLSPLSEEYDAYQISFARFHALLGNIEECEKYAALALGSCVPGSKIYEEASYYLAYCGYEEKDYGKCADILENAMRHAGLGPAGRGLYARALFKAGRKDEAAALFRELSERPGLTETDAADYAKILFAEGQLDSAYKRGIESGTPDGLYVAALCAFNRHDWSDALFYFNKYLDSGKKECEPYALFYSGYCLYRTGDNSAAYTRLIQFEKAYPGHNLALTALMTASACAVQAGNYANALYAANKAVESSSGEEDKTRAVILCASVYVDANQIQTALDTLLPYTSQKNVLGMSTSFQAAQIFARLGDLENSDRLYKSVAQDFSGHALGDEAFYRRGELFYSHERYADAAEIFDGYRKKHPSGRFIDASYFYSADCYARTGKADRAILQYTSLIKGFPDSVYSYNAKKNLAGLYRSQGKYDEALELCEALVREYPRESSKDGISGQIAELKRIASGANEALVKKQIEYESRNKTMTPEGRAAGTELAELLWKEPGSQDEAASLALELLAIQAEDENISAESPYAFRTALIAAQNERRLNNNSRAADLYLDAAKYARMAGDGPGAERALYAAVESFDAAGMPADSMETYAFMEEHYPSSHYTAQARKLIEKESR